MSETPTPDLTERAREEAWRKHLATKRDRRSARRNSFDAGFDAALAFLAQGAAERIADAVCVAVDGAVRQGAHPENLPLIAADAAKAAVVVALYGEA